MIDAFTRCNVCEASPAETLYSDQPMCYDCRAATAKAQKEQETLQVGTVEDFDLFFGEE